jgi:hypothetical protein
MWAGVIKCTVQCHVIIAWCPFIAAVNCSSHLPSSSFVFHPFALNMFLWHLFATHSSVIIIIFLLTASGRPSDALPVDALPPQRRPRQVPPITRCQDGNPSPCICDRKFGLRHPQPIAPHNCGEVVLDFTNPRDPHQLMLWASHLFLHQKQ